ncbi:MAG: hypothetical protein RJA22_408 [Verrucomicrobiota bacterium]
MILVRPSALCAALLWLGGAGTLVPPAPAAVVPVVGTNHTPVRIMAANLTGNSQLYEAPSLRLFQALKPDVVAIQEFNYLNNTAADLGNFVVTAFGTNYRWFRETNTAYSIPNGIISRWPILAAGSWDDLELGDRGFAWARLDLPGTQDLHVVSVHLKASTGTSNELRRANQAARIKSLVQSNFPPSSLVVVAGDCNIQSSNETALATFKSYLSDAPVPTDAVSGGDPDTNNGRDERYDYVFPGPTLNALRVGTTLGATTYPNGLVFDSRRFTPSTIPAPALTNDCATLQHMPVLRDFRVPYLVTNLVTVPEPALRLIRSNVVAWTGVTNLPYTVLTATNLPPVWTTAGVVISSTTTNLFFTNPPSATRQRYHRVLVP